MLNNSMILIFSLVAIFFVILARINVNKTSSTLLLIVSYLCIIFCITYSFLLGVEIDEVLTYILTYVLLFVAAFWNKDEEKDCLLKVGENV